MLANSKQFLLLINTHRVTHIYISLVNHWLSFKMLYKAIVQLIKTLFIGNYICSKKSTRNICFAQIKLWISFSWLRKFACSKKKQNIHMSLCLPFRSTWGSSPVFNGIRAARPFVFCTVCCKTFVLYVPFTASDCPFSIFWLPLWYLLITSLLSSDYPFGIFWLPIWYLLITPLVSSDYPFGIFWLPLWYLLITPLVSSHYPFGIFSLPLWSLLIIPLVSSDYPFGIFWLPL